MTTSSEIFSYAFIIKENHLDLNGHVNHANYLSIYEEARWEFLNKNGYGLAKIYATGLGPVILEAHVKYIRELKARDEVIIETQLLGYDKKIGRLGHTLLRGNEICSTAEIVFGLFDIKNRTLVLPTKEWLAAIGS